jgi:hypothetical protein
MKIYSIKINSSKSVHVVRKPEESRKKLKVDEQSIKKTYGKKYIF